MASSSAGFKLIGRDKYPWERWMNGRVWRVQKGRDFDCSIRGFQSSLINRATRFGVKVKIVTDSPKVEFKFLRSK